MTFTADATARGGSDTGPRRAALVAAGLSLVAAAATFGPGLGTPALGVDEAITSVVTRWPAHPFDRAIHGQESPLAPYYLAMRFWLKVSTAEAWLRLPSAVAMVVAVSVLIWWVARYLTTGAAAGTAAVLLALPSVSRFAQEARPYGATVMLAVLCSVAWWRLLRRGGGWSWLWYVASVYALGAGQALALTLVVAQVLAAAGPARRPGGGRPKAVLTTLAGASLAVTMLLPFLLLVQRHAVGNLVQVSPTPSNVWSVLAGSFSAEPHDALSDRLGLLVVSLAMVGAVRLREPAARGLLTYCWAWALVPVALLGAAAPFRPTLVSRYLLVSVPAWAVLAAQGCLVLGCGAAALASSHVRAPGTRRGVVALVALLPVAALVVLGLPRQQAFRRPGGHPVGDVRPVVALIDSAGYRDLPVLVLPDAWYGVQAYAYDPALPGRTALTDGLRVDDTGRLVLRNARPEDVDLSDPTGPVTAGLVVLVPTSQPGKVGQFLAPWLLGTGLAVDATTTLQGWTVVRLRTQPPAARSNPRT